MNTNYIIIGLLIVILIALIVFELPSVVDKIKNSSAKAKKEGFLLTSQNAYVDPVTSAIKGPGIMTNGFTRMPIDDITKRVNSNGFVSDNAISLGVGSGNGFDDAYDKQLDIQTIDDRNVGGYQSIDDLDQISRKIATSNNNSVNNMYTRAGSKPTKLIIEPNGIRGVIDEKYLPERDKNHQIATVQTVVPIQGYDVNIERLGEYLTDTHFSKISRNGKTKRIPTAAGAVGGGSKMNSNLEDNTVNSSPNKDAIQDSISVQGNDIAIKDTATGDTIVTPIDSTAGESFKQKYVRGNSR